MISDAADYGGMRETAGPLFTEPGPWAFAAPPEDRQTREIGEIIWQHQGRENTVNIAELKVRAGMKDERAVKGAVERLINHHGMLIGAARGAVGDFSGGYFMVRDAEDLEAWLGPYQAQIATMQARVRELVLMAKSRGIVRA